MTYLLFGINVADPQPLQIDSLHEQVAFCNFTPYGQDDLIDDSYKYGRHKCLLMTEQTG